MFNYSAVARDASGDPISSTAIGIQITILQSNMSGLSVYAENHSVNTDEYGLFNLVIGAGSIQSGDMNSIEWHLYDFYLQVGMDAMGGTNFLTMGTTQLLSVPYALHTSTADSLIGGNQTFSGDYNDLMNQPDNISSFTNDAGFVTTDNDQQVLSVSQVGDTLYISSGNWIIIPGISSANNMNIPGDGAADGSGNTYSSIIIGNQEWMQSNLRTTKYGNGDDIPSSLWCSINQDPSNDIPYGKSYEFAIIQDVRNVCPTGWHVPSNYEWNVLIKYIDVQADTITQNNSNLGQVIQSETAGLELKSDVYWNGTNESGFNAVSAGYSWGNSSFTNFGSIGYYWTSDVTDFYNNPCGYPCGAWMRQFYSDDSIEKSIADQELGHSIRCVKD